MDDFFLWREQRIIKSLHLYDDIKIYFNERHNETKLDETLINAPTVYRTWFSMFNKFYFITGRVDLKALLPVLYKGFDSWETG